jgi:hypothetical protein
LMARVNSNSRLLAAVDYWKHYHHISVAAAEYVNLLEVMSCPLYVVIYQSTPAWWWWCWSRLTRGECYLTTAVKLIVHEWHQDYVASYWVSVSVPNNFPLKEDHSIAMRLVHTVPASPTTS